MKRFSKVSFDDIKTIQVDSGVLLKKFDVENPVFLPENVICATSGGINPVCAPEYYDFGEDVDNAKESKETKRIRGWETSISFTTLSFSLNMIRYALGAADISGKALTLRQKLKYARDFKDIWWVGKRADDKLIAIRLIRSLSDSGFSLQTNKRGKGQISVTLKGHSSFAEKDKIPMEIYVLTESDIPIVPDEPETPTASEMYLYGTPSETGNIGLRSGESVTFYDGAVMPVIPAEYFKTHPYALIRRYEDDGRLYDYLWLMTEPCVHHSSVIAQSDFTGNGKELSFLSNHTSSEVHYDDWELHSTYETTSIPWDWPWIWSNFDIYETDSDELWQSAGADPIPVGDIVEYINDIPIYEVIR